MQRPFRSQSPNRVGSGPRGPPFSLVTGLTSSGNFVSGSFSKWASSGASKRPSGNFGFLRDCLIGSDFPPCEELVFLKE